MSSDAPVGRNVKCSTYVHYSLPGCCGKYLSYVKLLKAAQKIALWDDNSGERRPKLPYHLVRDNISVLVDFFIDYIKINVFWEDKKPNNCC